MSVYFQMHTIGIHYLARMMRTVTSTRPSISRSPKLNRPVKKDITNDISKASRNIASSVQTQTRKKDDAIYKCNKKIPVTRPATPIKIFAASKKKALLHSLQDNGEEDTNLRRDGESSNYRWQRFRPATSKIDGTVDEAKSRKDIRAAMRKAEGIEWDRRLFEDNRRRRAKIEKYLGSRPGDKGEDEENAFVA